MENETSNEIDHLDIKWPKTGDDAFADGDGRYTRAFLRWMGGDYRSEQLAHGYWSSAHELINLLETGAIARHPDAYFQPIGFLYRHFLELSLKNILAGGMELSILDSNDKRIIHGHKLSVLWASALKVIDELNPDADEDSSLQSVAATIHKFDSVDQTGQEFRYAFTTAKKISLAQAPDVVDLAMMREVMHKVYNFFQGIDCQISNAIEWERDRCSF